MSAWGSTPPLHALVSGGVVADLAYPSYCGVWLLFHAFEKGKNCPRADDDQNNPTARGPETATATATSTSTLTLSLSPAATLSVVHVPLWEALGRHQRKPTSPISRRPLVLQRHLFDNGRW